jgi:hypothetical protein
VDSRGFGKEWVETSKCCWYSKQQIENGKVKREWLEERGTNGDASLSVVVEYSNLSLPSLHTPCAPNPSMVEALVLRANLLVIIVNPALCG